jgi:uncharacterized protein
VDLLSIVILVSAGLCGGFLAGLVGVGGGVIFAPVLYFYFSHLGIPDEIATPMTLGTSLMCTFMAALSGAMAGSRSGLVLWRIALTAGAFSAVAVYLMTNFVTTQPWYSGTVFQVVLGVVLLVVVWRMLTGKRVGDAPDWRARARASLPLVGFSGAAAGSVAAAAGIGGGVVLVPIYNGVMRLPLKHATATSIATIVIISISGVISYVLTGLGADTVPGSLGYVDYSRAMVLGIPALVTARWGVQTAGRANVKVIRFVFAGFAGFVALRLLYGAIF